MDFIWKLLHWTGRERMGVLLVLTFGEGAGVEKVKSLKEIKIQFWDVEKILSSLEFYELAHLLLLPCTTKGSELKTL